MATVEVDGRVADLAGDVRRAVKQLALDDHTTADAGANRHPDDVSAAARRALPPFANCRAVRVVVERDGQAQAFADSIAQREVLPPRFGATTRDPFLDLVDQALPRRRR